MPRKLSDINLINVINIFRMTGLSIAELEERY
jgi:DNA-binding transcriptional MerR regulator